MLASFIGLDFGGSFIKAGLVSKNLKIKSFSEARVPLKATRGEVLKIIFGLIHKIKYENKLKKIKAIGIACAGPVDSKKGIVKVAPNFTHWKGKPFHLGKALKSKFKTHVQLENDTTAAAVAEFYSRKKKKRKITSLVTLTLGTGIGGGVVINGKPLRGLNWLGGEIGHVPLFQGQERQRCVCGNAYCAETYGSATALVKRFKELTKNNSHYLITNLTAEKIAADAKHGDPLSKQVFEEVGSFLGLLISIICNILDPDVVVIGGGMSKAHALFMPALKKKFSQHAFMHHLRKKNPIEISSLNKTAGLLGAVLCVHKGKDSY